MPRSSGQAKIGQNADSNQNGWGGWGAFEVFEIVKSLYFESHLFEEMLNIARLVEPWDVCQVSTKLGSALQAAWFVKCKSRDSRPGSSAIRFINLSKKPNSFCIRSKGIAWQTWFRADSKQVHPGKKHLLGTCGRVDVKQFMSTI